MAQQGNFFVIEGTDGSGKGTQFKLLAESLQKAGYEVATFDFPRYTEESSYFVRKYLNGKYGSADEVGPYTGSLFFSLDRYEAAPAIREAIEAGKIVLANRYTGSNMAHQGTKFSNVEQRRGYFIWLDNLEFQMLGIPRPDLNIVLRVPAEIAQTLVDKKEKRNYTDKKRDIHEADLGHMQRSVEVYDDLCKLFPKDFSQIDCVRSDELLDIGAVHSLLWEKLQPLLPKPPKQGASAAAKAPVILDNPYVKKLPSGTIITNAGHSFLNEAVTTSEGNVYGFTDKLGVETIAAAMARLSRRGDDMRLIILDEFADAAGKDEALLKRVITAYGDDSVQQLVGRHFVIENTTKLMTNILERGRLAAYLEQSTRYIYFDERDQHGNYRYYVPPHFDANVKSLYCDIMDQIFEKYSTIVHSLTDYIAAKSDTPKTDRDTAWKNSVRAQACDAARVVLPAATTTTVGMHISGQSLEAMIIRLLSEELPEARTIGKQLLAEARKLLPAFLERADLPERGGATTAYRANTKRAVRSVADTLLSSSYDTGKVLSAELTDIWPRNELDLVPDMLYEHADQSLSSIREDVSGWHYDKKIEVFEAYIGERLNRRHKPGRALEKAHYSWDLLCDFGIFCDLQRHRMVDDLQWQQLTPRYGYEVPKLVEEAGLTELLEDCFDLSLRLYSALQQAGYQQETQYAALLGHKMRLKMTYNARQAFRMHELRTSPQGHPSYRKLVTEMHELLAQKHPLLASAMCFVNKDEDPRLTRLAAERAAQFKLEDL